MSTHLKGLSSPPEVSSSHANITQLLPMAEPEGEEETHQASEDEELELGLSLGAKTRFKGSRRSSRACGQRGEYSRILTAKDFNSIRASKVSPISSSSSVCSSSSLGGKGAAGGGGSNRASDPLVPSQMVGWPPIRAFRINNLFNHVKDHSPDGSPDTQQKVIGDGIATLLNASNNIKSTEEVGNVPQSYDETKPKTFFVKVTMDGMPIGRKVDLTAHRSYEMLALTLEDMFLSNSNPTTNTLQMTRTSKLLNGSSEFVLTYKDRDGDWMLVGDVPWGMFLSTVRRLRIMRTTDANGLPPRFRSQRP